MHIPTTKPFSFAHTLTFCRRFLPIAKDYLLDERSITAAIAVDGRAVPFTLRDRTGEVELVARAHERVIAQRASDWIGARDDVAAFYERAEGDAMMQRLIALQRGLHHLRFLTLEEIAVYSVMMQRAPVNVATTLRRRFLERFGLAVDAGGKTLRAFPSFDALLELDGDDIGEAIGNRRKGPQIANVVRGVAAIGEPFLRTAPYAQARDALLDVPGIGPFSAGAILLRGLGRMDELPSTMLAELAPRMGSTEQAVRARYGDQIGYWSFYVKSGLARLDEEPRIAGALRNQPARVVRRSAA